ncbi:MAG: type VI secretion system-associated protein TagF [Desulfobacteraceae bacterium]|nr:type VI secretion system-associated protein TagF [Desulfobacteraceae bacterium]
MLGIGKQKAGIEVSAYGKHPAFDDYFSINMEPPLANALSSWVENGMTSGGTADKNRETRSFRFWVPGIKKEELILGIVRDSSDRLGRTYPLLIMGRTRMKDRDTKWPAIFSGFEPVFRAFEEMTTIRYQAFKEFEASLLKIQFSEPDFEKSNTSLSNCLTAWFKMEKERSSLVLPVSKLLDKFASHPHEPPKKGIFKTNSTPPNAVFLGGLPDNPMVNMYNRPLKTRDFPRLFNLSGFEQSNGHQNNMDFHTQ